MQVHIVQQAIPPAALSAVCRDAHSLADCSNFWLPKERVLQGPASCSTPAELAVCLLYQHVAHLLPPTWQGAEYWLQVYKPGVGLGFHFDKDEHLLKSTGHMVHPAWSSILYLTGSSSSSSDGGGGSGGQQQQQQQQQQEEEEQQRERPDISTLNDCDGIRQSPTVILQQLFDQEAGCPVPSVPSSSMLVWPLKGTYCVFDGRLGHGVLDSCSSSIRATLLVNWWTACPQAVEVLQDSSIQQHNLTRLNSSGIQQLLSQPPPQPAAGSNATDTPAIDNTSSSLSHQLAALATTNSNKTSPGGGSSDSSSGSAGGQHAALQHSTCCCTFGGDLEELSSDDGQQEQQQGASKPQLQQQDQQQQQNPLLSVADLPCVTVKAAQDTSGGQEEEEEGAGMHLVDDVLAEHNLTLVGPGAVSAVRFDHPGFVLCPIEDPAASQGQGAEPQQQQATNTAAGGSGVDSSSGGGAEGRLQTLGAFVSAELLGSDSDEDDESDGSDGSGKGS